MQVFDQIFPKLRHLWLLADVDDVLAQNPKTRRTFDTAAL